MAITESPFTGAPLYLKDSAWASKFFGGASMLNSPKRKFTYFVCFSPNRDVVSPEIAREISFDDVFLLKSFDPPRLEFDTEIIDQYNKKRIVQKRVNYAPVSMRFHDDSDNKIFSLITEYFKYYYGDAYHDPYNDWRLDTITDFVKEGTWGFMPKRDKYFFQSIIISWVNGGRFTWVNLRNPVIADISFDTLDYADGATPLEISMTLNYEGFVPREINTPIDASKPLAQIARELLQTTENIGQPFEGPNPQNSQEGRDRTPGLGELVNAGQTFFGKYNDKPTVEDFAEDFLLRPVLGSLGGTLNSWGNFNFGGIGQAKSEPGLVSGGFAGDTYKYTQSGQIVNDAFRFGFNTGSGSSTSGNSSLGDPPTNDRYRNVVGPGSSI